MKKLGKINWTAIIGKLNESKTGTVKMFLGTPGSAQVTRCRLLAGWNHISAKTEGSCLTISLTHPGN